MPKSKVKYGIRCLYRSASVAVAIALLINFPGLVTAQSQSLQSVEQQVALEEAERLTQQVEHLYKEGKYNTALPLAERILAIQENILGNSHPLVAQSLNNLAALYQGQGNYQKAEPLLLRSLAIVEKVSGNSHPNVAITLSNLAALYLEQGSYQNAEPLLLRSLAIFENALGNSHPDVALSLNNLAGVYYKQGSYQKAEPLLLRSLAIREKVLGNSHPLVAATLSNLAGVYLEQGNYQNAEPLLLRSLVIREKVLGNSHPDVATTLNDLARMYLEQGNYQKTEPLLLRSLAIREKVLGNSHPLVAATLNNLARMYQEQASYQKAETLYQHSLAIIEKAVGNSHPDVATTLSNLADLYRQQGNYQKAELLYQRSMTINEKVLGNSHPDVATTLSGIAKLYKEQGNYQKAELLYQRSLAIVEKVLGKKHSLVAATLNNLAELYREQGSYQKAEPLFQQSLTIFEEVLGKSHPSVAATLNNLSIVYLEQGNYQKAELLFLRSLAIAEKVLGNSHPDVANTLNNLARLYRQQGNYQKAEILYQRSLAILEKVLGKEHPSVAATLNNLADLYQQRQGSYQKAEPLLQRSLAIVEKVLGNSHPFVATPLNNLSLMYLKQGSYQKAEPLLQRSLTILEKGLGKEHPFVATTLNNLADLYQRQGSYQKAESLLQRSLAIREKALGNSHPDVATTLSKLALLYWAEGNITRATNFFRRGLSVEDRNLGLIFAVGSEQRKQDYARTFTGTTNGIISLSLHKGVNDPEIARLALTTVLRRKGLVLDAVADSIQTLRSQLTNQPETQKLFDQWLSIQQQQSALVYKGQEKQSVTDYQAKFQQLQQEKERLEEAISAKSAEFASVVHPVELQAIQAQIPAGAALIEMVLYYPFNPKAKLNESFGEPRYAAAVLRNQGEPSWVDLGDAATIDKLIASLRTELATQPEPDQNQDEYNKSIHAAAHNLEKLIIKPISPLLGNARHLLLSPDGQLTQIPFEALRDDKGEYLIQRYAFSYLSSGRDLLRFSSQAKSMNAPVVFANIDYNNQETVATTFNSSQNGNSQNQRSIDLASLHFSELSATKEEAEKIKAFFPDARVLQGQQATETAIKQLHAPSILHLATHGFFFEDTEVNLVTDKLGKQPKTLNLENPLLRSGVVLAGANNRKGATLGANDGILTALEVSGLDLRSTGLVVLSACATGLGDVKIGDGVYGLRRALVIAGSQSQVLSLWVVSDNATKNLMVKYYQYLKAGEGRHDALRSAQLSMLSNPKYQHPYYWASFVASGDWTPLHKSLVGK
jgi:tetratricopeptide (TPR) repeat protein